MSRLLTASPWRRAPLLAARQPAVALAMAVTVALLGLAIASYPLYLASSGSGAVSVEEAQRCPDGLDSTVIASGPTVGIAKATNDLNQESNTDLTAAGASPANLQPAYVTLDQTGLGARLAAKSGAGLWNFQLASRTDGLSNITVLSSAGGQGVWLPSDLASNIGAKAGDDIAIGADPTQAIVPPAGPVATVRVAGIYRDIVGTVLPRFWCTQTDIFGSFDSASPPPPVVLATSQTLLKILASVQVQDVTSYQWERMLSPGLTLPQTEHALSGMQRLASKVGVLDTFRPQAQDITPIGGGLAGTSQVVNELVFIVNHAKAVQTALRSGILPVSLAGIAVTALLVAAAGSYWADRRRLEIVLLSSKGAGPASLGLKAALESLIPAAVGAVVGWAVAYGLVSAIGPSSSLPLSSVLEALWLAIAAGVLSLILVWIVSASRVRATSSTPRLLRSHIAKVPFELIALGLSIWAWSTLGQQSLQVGATSAPGVGASFLAFPILFVLSLAALGARITSIVLSSRWFRRATSRLGHPSWLASRRLSGASRIAALCVASVAAAIGILIYGSALTASQNATIDAKAETFVGSITSVQLASSAPIPASLAGTTTAVYSSPNAQFGSTDVNVIAVDPATFARGAFWNSSFSGQSLQSLLDELGASQHPGTIPAIIADGNGQSGALSLQVYGKFSRPLPVYVVASVPYFPGEDSEDPLVITTTTAIKQFGVPTEDLFWSKEQPQVVLADLQRAGANAAILVTESNVLDQTTFEAISWTFSYLQAFGILSGAVIFGGLLLFVSTRARARALAYVLARRMGMRRVTHLVSLIIEIGVMLVPGAVIGAVVGWIAVELAEPHLNPLPSLSPPPLIEIPALAIGLATVATICIWGFVSSWAQHIADRSRASDLLRADD
jgi:putative ABC transport system permease protein